ncbi:hypothetical protein RI129_001202 [Pyrocoelia pectoralis]|uniref:Protein farnesyltransferase/geranylgeranyltransferase type-1 subunit alpha n=1 Tax=Pyrocoelia pectoralis TaxID=417401 RepID=A0AAN7VW39_9COLE
MGDSSSDDENVWVFYKDRSEWKDVDPVPQDDGNADIAAIRYTAKFKDVYDYFRAVLTKQEKSERALQLTKDAAELNPANYTVWQFRRDILKTLNKDLYEELEYSQHVIDEHPKNYQVWHHRRVLVEWLQDSSKELHLTELILNDDAKNYHAWQHRQWAIKTFNLFENELSYVDQLIQDDIRNNSAWNQRYFVINNTSGFTSDVLKSEISYTLDKIKIAKENESAWNYLRGLLLHDKEGLSKNETVRNYCEQLYAAGNRSPFLLAFLVDMCDELINQGGEDTRYTLDRAKDLCNSLATQYDKIRARYWNYMAEKIQNKAEGKSEPMAPSSSFADDES